MICRRCRRRRRQPEVGLKNFDISTMVYGITVADLEIQKGGFSHWRAKHARKFLGCHAHFGHAGSPN